jgi:hypothetical protein
MCDFVVKPGPNQRRPCEFATCASGTGCIGGMASFDFVCGCRTVLGRSICVRDIGRTSWLVGFIKAGSLHTVCLDSNGLSAIYRPATLSCVTNWLQLTLMMTGPPTTYSRTAPTEQCQSRDPQRFLQCVVCVSVERRYGAVDGAGSTE